MDYCLEENNILHIKYKLKAKRDLKLSKIQVFYKILLENDPDFTWVPHIRPEKDLVIGDHVFRSPVIIYKKNNISFAFIPDLKTLGKNRPFQAFLDFSLNEEESPYIAYGFGNYEPYRHMFFKHQPEKEFIIKPEIDLTFRFYIITFENKTVSEILNYVNRFFWQKYMRKNLYENLEPQVLPYDINVKESFNAIFLRHYYWGDLKINNIDCGGFWGLTSIGKDKDPLKFITEEEINDLLNTYLKGYRNAVIFNTAWYSNIRSAYGIRFFGELWKEKSLIDKSSKILNLILELPRDNGVFPSLIAPESHKTDKYSYSIGTNAWWHLDYYNLVDTTVTMYWAIKLSFDFNLKQDIVIERSRELAEFMLSIQLDNGVMPPYVQFNNDGEPEIINDLLESASSGAPLMFLLEYHKMSNDAKIIPICEKIAEFIQNEIIPVNKWHDFEAFYSCTSANQSDYDHFTKSHIMNNLSIYWCAEGFLELYRITGKLTYLNIGEYILALLSLFQQVWDMPYISYNTFGGFGVQNADAELGDARQALFVKTYMQYYLETGKEEYMERGIAALRASWALQLLSEYKKISPGNLIGLEAINTVDRGCMSENYGHSGRDERIHQYILFDWGNGTATTATAYAKKHFGDLFIDFKEKLIWGIDGVLMKHFDFYENKIEIDCDFIKGKDYLLIKSRDSPVEPFEIILNGKSIYSMGKELLNGFSINI